MITQKIFTLWILTEILIFPTQTLTDDSPSVTTKLMLIKGRYKTSYENRLYEAFEGIPYAQPPMGEHRFQPPRPIVTRVDHVIFALNEPNFCSQYDYMIEQIRGEEDCLYLNIYVPVQQMQNRSLLPIIIWIHEGSFQRGGGTETKAKYLMDRDIILVTFNYRLGMFGFLSTEDNIVSGNMGLKDQNLAIRWVVDNIRLFGGDPKKISLFGASAGGSSVQYHYLSKSSAGLFRNGVSFSGTALSPWAYDPKPLETAKNLASTVGCSTESSMKMVDCLKSLSTHVLLRGVIKILKETKYSDKFYPLFVPVAEKNITDYFINRSPDEILRSSDVYDVPWTSGVVSEDGAYTNISNIVFNKTQLNYINMNWEKLIPYSLMYDRTLSVYMHAEVARAARQHYIKTAHLKSNPQTIWGMVYMQTHKSFSIVLEKTARLQAKANQSPVYTYYYSYKAAMSTIPSTYFHFVGTSHLDDIFLVLENQYIDPTTTKEDKDMLEMMLDFWYSAATTGKPKLMDTELLRIDPKDSEFKYFEIAGPRNCSFQGSNNFGDKQFWRSVGFDLEV